MAKVDKELTVTFKVNVGDYPNTKLTRRYIENRLMELNSVVLESFEETLYDIKFEETPWPKKKD